MFSAISFQCRQCYVDRRLKSWHQGLFGFTRRCHKMDHERDMASFLNASTCSIGADACRFTVSMWELGRRLEVVLTTADAADDAQDLHWEACWAKITQRCTMLLQDAADCCTLPQLPHLPKSSNPEQVWTCMASMRRHCGSYCSWIATALLAAFAMGD